MFEDIRFGLRVLRKHPSFALISVLTLAIGIGANAAIFSVVSSVLLEPLPYRDPDRLVTLWERHPAKGVDKENVSPPDFADWRAQQKVFERLAFWSTPADMNLVTEDGAVKVRAVYATSDLFPTLAINPLLGRTFVPEEDQREGNRSAILGYELWQRRFGGSPDAIGKTITIDTFGRRDYTVVGILPAGFRFPDESELWLPAGWNGLSSDRRQGHWLTVLARLKPGVTLEAAQVEMNAIQAGIASQFPSLVIGTHVAIVPLLEQTLGPKLRAALLVLWAIVACVLLIACANVANLTLASAAVRQREIAIRLALGASRLRVARQLMTESLILAVAGGILGLLLGVFIVRLIVAFNAGHVPRLDQVRIDPLMLLFTAAVTLGAGFLFGLAPAWQFTRPSLVGGLKESGKTGTAGLERSRLRGLLVVSQMTLALLLLIGAGLLTRSLIGLMTIDRGFNSNQLLTASLDFSVYGFTTWIRPTATRPQVTLNEIMSRLRSQPGVRSVAAVSSLPRGTSNARGIRVAFENRANDWATSPQVAFHGVSPDYFKTMGIRMISGREFTDNDTLEGNPVAILSESAAKRYFPNEDPVGKRLAMYGRNPGELAAGSPFTTSPWIEIVGVAGDARRMTLEGAIVPDIFKPYWQWPMQTPVLLVRHDTDAAAITTAIIREVRSVNRSVPAPAIRSMDAVLSEVRAQPRFYTLLSGLFSVVALVLAAIGIYGVMSYSVSQRTREIGIRVALGAMPGAIARLVIGQGLKLALYGIVLGMVLAFGLTRMLESLLFGVSARDPMTIVGATLILGGIAIVASYLPARRALRLDPAIALRDE